jgi:hypothetical protein
MVHSATLSATKTSVAADGTITTRWSISDIFDYEPDDEGHNAWYRRFAIPIHFIYNTVLGAEEKLPTNVCWDETIAPDD